MCSPRPRGSCAVPRSGSPTWSFHVPTSPDRAHDGARQRSGGTRSSARLVAPPSRGTTTVGGMDSIPVGRGRSFARILRSDPAAGPHPATGARRWCWSLRSGFQPMCALTGLRVTFSLVNPKIDGREVAGDRVAPEAGFVCSGQKIPDGKGEAPEEPDVSLGERGAAVVAPSVRGRATAARVPVHGVAPAHRVRQRHLADEFDRERFGGRTPRWRGDHGVSVPARALRRLPQMWRVPRGPSFPTTRDDLSQLESTELRRVVSPSGLTWNITTVEMPSRNCLQTGRRNLT